MREGKDKKLLIGCTLCAGLLAAVISVALTTHFYRQEQFRMLDAICQEMGSRHPEIVPTLLDTLKTYQSHPDVRKAYGSNLGAGRGGSLLSAFGYRPSDLLQSAAGYGAGFAGIGFFVSGALFLWLFWYWNRTQERRVREIREYLERVYAGADGVLFPAGEDEFSRLQDEIYKTVTEANQARDEAWHARNSFAQNLSNIAHQLKTPITSISLSAQMLKEKCQGQEPEQIGRQLDRLTRLEESLLILSRIDAGTLPLEAKRVDVFTLLSLAADSLQELCEQSGVTIEVPELGEAAFTGDLEWTMEAVMNLMKNCVEHSKAGGRVSTFYEQNPLYLQIQIRDQGRGFLRRDLPHLFERFYRGEGAVEGGIGIGLALAREIVERQNGVVRAENLAEGGACFEIRFYCHQAVT